MRIFVKLFDISNIEGSKKYRQLVTTAKDLIFRYGFKRVTIEEICATANVSKMTFYKYFRNKEELVLFILKSWYDWADDAFMAIWTSPMPFSEKIRQAVKLKMDISNEISDEMIYELVDASIPQVNEFLMGQRQAWIGKLKEFFIDAQQKGELRQDIKPEFILFVLTKVSEWAEDQSLTALYDNPRDMIRELLNFYINGLVAKEPIVSKKDV